MYPYQKLETWRRAHKFALSCYHAAEPIRVFAMRSQLRRAACSTVANLVEGASSQSDREFGRFLGIAIASANEADYHLLFCTDVGLLPHEVTSPLRDELREITRMLQGLRKTVRSSG